MNLDPLKLIPASYQLLIVYNSFCGSITLYQKHIGLQLHEQIAPWQRTKYHLAFIITEIRMLNKLSVKTDTKITCIETIARIHPIYRTGSK